MAQRTLPREALPVAGFSVAELQPFVVTRQPVSPVLTILGEFALEYDGDRVELPQSVRRLLAFLATCGRRVTRSHVAGTLWPDVTDERAAGNLRSTLWRLRQAGAPVVAASPTTLALEGEVRVDLHQLREDARQCIAGGAVADDLDARLGGELLPDWYDAWLVLERERLRQLRLHALETLCHRLTEDGELGRAIDVAMSAVAVEPLRESSHRALVTAHLKEGNVAEGLRAFKSFRTLIRDELGIEPSQAMTALVREWLGSSQRSTATAPSGAARHTRTSHPTSATPGGS